jgi:1-phosphofructokinase
VQATAADGLAIALDASGTRLREAVERVPALIDLIKPNEEELAELVGVDPATLNSVEAIAAAARPLLDAGVGAVLLTRGADGAVLLTADGTWVASAPPVQPRSTVGAGDSALAGYLLGALDGLDPAKRLSLAVAYGSAAASLPGSTMPTPADLPALSEARRWNKG